MNKYTCSSREALRLAQYENAFTFSADELNPGYQYTTNSNASHNLLVFQQSMN